MSEERVSHVGGAALRPRQRWTPAVHAALLHLRGAGFLEAPAPLGMDARIERTSWIDGASGPAGWGHAAGESGLIGMARLLRRLHEAGRGFVLPDGLDWADQDAPRRGGTLCHGDFGPWNLVWKHDEPVGVIDWDLVRLGDPMDDVHYALEYVAPFRDDIEAVRWLGHPRPPDRRARIVRFWCAHAQEALHTDVDVEALVEGVIGRQRTGKELTLRLAAEGVEPQATWVRDGFEATLDSRIAWSEANRGLLTARAS